MVITDVNTVTYNGDGSTTAFPYTFVIIDSSDVKIQLADSDGFVTEITSDYYVDTTNSTVYYPGYAPGSEPPEADQPPKVQSGQKITLYRKVPVNQLASLGATWPFAVIEKGLDKLTMIAQDIYSWTGRNIMGLATGELAWDAKQFPIHNVGGPVDPQDASTKKYVDSLITGIIAQGGTVAAVDTVEVLRETDVSAGMYAVTKGRISVNDGCAAAYSIRVAVPGDTDDGDNIILLDNGNVAEKLNDSRVQFLFPGNKTKSNWDCEIIVTNTSVLMIDSGTDDADIRSYLINFMQAHGIKKVDYFLLTHYHSDHDGNIIPFLNQSTIDFSQTKWYLPDVTLGYSSHKTDIIAALTAHNADFEVLLDDKTVSIAPDVTMKIMGANSTYIQFIDNNITTPTDLNPYSLVALITHKDVKALYTGDIGAPAVQALMKYYTIPKVNVMKIPHHGMNTSYSLEYDTLFYTITAPDYATTNSNHYNFVQRVSASAPFSSDKREHVQFAYANGAEILPLRFGDVALVSDGNDVHYTTFSRSVDSYFNATPMQMYVDASYTETDCDGSSDKPFPDLNSLIDALTERQYATGVNVNIKSGTYASLILTSFPSEITFTATGGTVSIGNLYIKNCSDIAFFGGFSLKALQVFKSNVTFSNGTVTLTPDDTYTHIYDNNVALKPGDIYNTGDTPLIFADSLIYMVALTINGASMPADYSRNTLGYILKSLVDIRTLTVAGVTKPSNYVLQVLYGSVAQIDAVDIDTTDKNCFRLQFGSMVLINSATLGANFTASLFQNNGGFFWNNGAGSRGATADRPNVKTVPNGYAYLDTTVGCLIVKNGSNWYKATDGTTV